MEDIIADNYCDNSAQDSMDVDSESGSVPISATPSEQALFSRSATLTPATYSLPYSFINDDDDDPDYIPPGDITSFHFTEVQLTAIRTCICDITLTTWVDRPPSNLEEASHGKLKAQDYLTLFASIFPLVIPELWYPSATTSVDNQYFQSFYHLVAATNIISFYTISNAEADKYTQHYVQYRASLQHLFFYCQSKPNHHYAMHNGDLLKYWGPLASFSKFSGERLNGLLQKISTNGKKPKC